MVAKRKPEPIRKRLTIPRVNESVLTWFDLQDDASASVRHLIQESIQRDGYVDIVNRPVGQLPRRGRPPAEDASSIGPAFDQSTDADDDDSEGEDSTGTGPEEIEEAEHQTELEPGKQAAEPVAEKTQQQMTKEPELEDIFGSMRD